MQFQNQRDLFKHIWYMCEGRCFVTDKYIPLERSTPSNFAHILSKGAYPKYKLNPDNIMFVVEDVHYLYDCRSKQDLLNKYDNERVEEIYSRKEKLKREYYR